MKKPSIFFFLVLASGCASDGYLRRSGHAAFARRDYSEALRDFQEAATKEGPNQLLFLLDQGTTLFAMGEYRQAVPIFLRAEKLAEIKDYTSISEEVGVLATGQGIRGYKGEDFEKVLIHVYLALSFSALGDVEAAQVEARKINLLLYRMIHEGKRRYQESPWARYLSAMLWEETRDWDAAYIDYKEVFKLDAAFPNLGQDLLATAARLREQNDVEQYRKKWPDLAARSVPKGHGEVVVIFEQGLGPVKRPRVADEHTSLPMYVPRFSAEKSARLRWVDGTLGVQHQQELIKVLDVEALSHRYLEDRISRLQAAQLAGLAVKGAVAATVGSLSKDSDLGIFTFYILAALDTADLRAWQSLPASFQMARLAVPAGVQNLQLDILNAGGQVLRTRNFDGVTVKAGRKVFLVAR